jgi:uncharacterized membrane protein
MTMKIYFRIFRAIRKYLLAGLGILLPLFISLYIIYFSLSDRFAGRFINVYLKDTYGFIIPGVGFFLIAAMLVITGFVTTRLIGQKLFSLLEIMLIKVPLLANLYPPAKQLSDYLFKKQKYEEFKKVVLVEFTCNVMVNRKLDFLRVPDLCDSPPPLPAIMPVVEG